MLKCRYTQARIPALINQELTVHTRRYLMRHMATCPHCRAEYEAQKQVREQLLRDMPQVGQPTTAALRRVWNAIEQDVVPRPRVLWRWSWLYSGAALLLVLVALPFVVVSSYQATPAPLYAITRIEEQITHTPTRVSAEAVPTLVAQAFSTQPKGTELAEILHNTPATPDPDSY